MASWSKITAGKLFTSGNVAFGKNIYEHVRKKTMEKRKEMQELYDRKLAKYEKNLLEYNMVIQKNIPADKLGTTDLKALLRAIKEDSDGAMPSRKADLLAMYNKLKGRGLKPKPNPPKFEEFALELNEEVVDGKVTQTAEL